AKVLGLDFGRVAGERQGQLVSRFVSDASLLHQTLIRAPNSLIRDPLQIVALVAAMVWRDWILAVVVLLVYPVAAVPVLRIGRRLRRVSAAAQEQMGDLTGFLTERFAAMRLIKTYGLEATEKEKAGDVFDRRFQLNSKTVRARAAVEPVIEVVGAVAVSGVIAVAGYRISAGVMTVGDFLGFVTALIMLAQPARSLGTVTAVLQEGVAGLQRIYDLVDETPRIEQAAGRPPLQVREGRVTFRNVAFRYGEEAPALSGLSFEAAPGAMVALVGESGAGKSTVFNLLPRLYEPDAGEILIDGQDILQTSLESLRSAMAVVSQDAVLLDDTVGANIAFGRLDARLSDIERAAKAAAADEFVRELPNGYDAEVGPSGGRLSGGQRQRIALARAILKDAPILLLDEATSALDAVSEQRIQEALGKLRRGRTTIVIAHRLATVRGADRIYVLDKGRVVEEGRHDELYAQGGRYARLCDLQFRSEAA
ncbi:MAG: ABC transporter ATP-binding protein, partial [Pseudomonadota bacterium]